ncbi:hypothetical protein N184_30460 [Sinorhizobium sp. GL28]|nr:hypothetical protein N184_30460 [Sinorhizobium sp. GL28]
MVTRLLFSQMFSFFRYKNALKKPTVRHEAPTALYGYAVSAGFCT